MNTSGIVKRVYMQQTENRDGILGLFNVSITMPCQTVEALLFFKKCEILHFILGRTSWNGK